MMAEEIEARQHIIQWIQWVDKQSQTSSFAMCRRCS